MTKIIVLLCFLCVHKKQLQAQEYTISNEFVFNMGAGVSAAHSTDLLSKQTGNSLTYTPAAEIFLKKYFTKLGEVKLPLYVALGAQVHLSSSPTKPIMPQVRVGCNLGEYFTPFFARVWQKAATSDYPKHADNRNYWGYGVEIKKRIAKDGVLYMTISKNDRYVIGMISMGFVF